MHLRSIICPVDFSDGSRQALRWAVAIARRFESALTVLTAVDPLLAEAARSRFGLDLARGESEPELRRFVREVVPDDVPWAPEMAFDVRVGQPADVILAASLRPRADLIVMGTEGLGGLKKMLLGSTAERVLRAAALPVLAVPPQAFASVAADAAGVRLEIPRILAATDFSDTGAAAVEWAASLAAAIGVPLTLAHVVEPVVVAPQWSAYAALPDEPRIEEARAKLERLAPRTGGPARDVAVAVGAAPETIASLAEEHGAGLIVMGLTGGQGPLAARPGSIAYRVLGLASMPVAVVPPLPSSP